LSISSAQTAAEGVVLPSNCMHFSHVSWKLSLEVLYAGKHSTSCTQLLMSPIHALLLIMSCC
jgi:hypothetical protein